MQSSSTEELRKQRRDLLHELTRQGEIRKQEVRQMLKQSAESREKESTDLRISRVETLKKISAELSLQRADARIATESPAPKKTSPMSPAIEPPPIAVRRWTPGQWTPGQWTPSRSTFSPGKSTPSPATPSPATPSPDTPSPATPSPAKDVSPIPPTGSADQTRATALAQGPPPAPSPAPPPAPALANAQFDHRLLALEERYSKLFSALQDQFDLTSRIEALTSQLDREMPDRLDRKLAAESESLSKALTSQWQGDISLAMAQTPATNTDISDIEILVEKLAAEFRSFATEFTTRLATFDAQTAGYQTLQRRVDWWDELLTIEDQTAGSQTLQRRVAKLEVMLTEYDTAVGGTRTEVAALQARLGRTESNVVSAIDILQHSGSPAIVEEMQARLEKIEAGLTGLIESLQSQPSPLAGVNHPDPSSNQLLSNLSRLMSGLRQAQAERLSEFHSVP